LSLFSSRTVLTLPQGLLVFASEIVALVVLATMLARVADPRRQPGRARRHGRRFLVVSLLALAVVAAGVRNVRNTGLVLRDANRRAVGQRPGIDRCLAEAPPPSRAPFVEWLRTRMPAHALYEVALGGGGPDLWCVTLTLLPRLPIGPHDHPRYLVAFGVVPAAIEARIKAHDPTVQVFAAGYALARVTS
jgi:hypothetical protein